MFPTKVKGNYISQVELTLKIFLVGTLGAIEAVTIPAVWYLGIPENESTGFNLSLLTPVLCCCKVT